MSEYHAPRGVGAGFGVRGQSAVQASGKSAPVEDDSTQEAPTSVDEDFDPADHTIDDVKAHVEANPEEAADILSMEEGGKDRSTLVEWLEHFLDT